MWSSNVILHGVDCKTNVSPCGLNVSQKALLLFHFSGCDTSRVIPITHRQYHVKTQAVFGLLAAGKHKEGLGKYGRRLEILLLSALHAQFFNINPLSFASEIPLFEETWQHITIDYI